MNGEFQKDVKGLVLLSGLLDALLIFVKVSFSGIVAGYAWLASSGTGAVSGVVMV